MRVLLNFFYSDDINLIHLNFYPLGLLSLAAYMKKRMEKADIKVVVGQMNLADVQKFKPDIIGFTALTPYFSHISKLAQSIRKNFPVVPIICGGHHITYLPDTLPLAFDAAVLGEGEQTFFEICMAILQHPADWKSRLGQIHGVAYHSSHNVVRTHARQNLMADHIPVLRNYDICEFKTPGPVYFQLITSRGCYYKCHFCSSAHFWHKIRFYPTKTVVDQIQYMVELFRPQEIMIYDDMMIGNFKHLVDLKNEICKRGLQKQTSFGCWMAGTFFNRETCSILREMNVTNLKLAVESGSPSVYKSVKGRWNTPLQNAEAVRLAHRYGFELHASIIVGIPGETIEDLKATYKYVKNLPFTSGQVFLLKVFPGTEIWRISEEQGFVSRTMNNWHLIENNNVMNPETIYINSAATRKETHKYYRKIKRMLILRTYLSKFLKKIRGGTVTF